MELTKEQIESLAKFALDILSEFPEMGDFDGGDIQDIAITRNLLVPQIVHAPCAEEDCNCAQFYDDADFTAGVTCYHVADWLDRVAEQRDAPVHAEQNGASELVCTFDNDGGGIDIDVLKKFLKGKRGWLTAQSHANGQVQFSMTPHSNRSAGG